MAKRASNAIYNATNRAIRAANHLKPEHGAAVAALRFLAKKIDSDATMRDLVMERLKTADPEADIKFPPVDNVSVPTFLRYLEALGLTPDWRPDGTAKGAAPKVAPVDDLAAFKQANGIA
ncbi:terminase small subunit [Pseudoclavibacter helvolus]|uniref:terminase small subunit n=1 Tax=Pseudoclavibacter helvolus TaxID=255205 RepID=UPI003736A28B